MSKDTLVLGLGNPLRGDDGVGTAVVAALRSRTDLPAGVELLDGGAPGLETALLLQDYQRVIIVDAADMQLKPGEWRQFFWDAALVSDKSNRMLGTLHDAGLAEALALADALNILPPTVLIMGIQPQKIGWEQGLSPDVLRSLPEVCQSILQFLLGK